MTNQQPRIETIAHLHAWLESRGKVEIDGRVYEPADVRAMDVHAISAAISAGRMLEVAE